MRRALVYVMSALLVCALGLWGGVAWGADTGGYGSSSSDESSGGYGSSSSSESSSGGYGGGSDSSYGGSSSGESTGGYGGAAAESESTGGYGGAAAESESTGGYGGGAAESESTGGYGGGATEPVVKAEATSARRGPQPVSLMFLLSGLLVGVAAGFVLQRGRFCMNSAFRDTIFIKDFTFFRAYVIALMVMIVGANIIQDIGLVSLTRQPIWFIAQPLGGYIFGLGMVLAGGCGSGIIYRVGEGQINAIVAVLGFFLSIAVTSHGALKPVYEYLRSFHFSLFDQSAPALYHVIGDTSAAKWITIAVIVIPMAIFVWKGGPFKFRKSTGFFWSVTGLLFGLVGIAAFWASDYFGGFARGLSFTTPTRDIFFTLIMGDPLVGGTPFKVHRLGYLLTTWPAVYIIGVPLGAYLSAKILKEFKWKTPPAQEMLTVFGGSLMMGFGATLGGGCNVGQALTGFATLSIGSIVATIAIILGNWTMVYFKFIKPMQDLDLD